MDDRHSEGVSETQIASKDIMDLLIWLSEAMAGDGRASHFAFSLKRHGLVMGMLSFFCLADNQTCPDRGAHVESVADSCARRKTRVVITLGSNQ